MISHFGMLTIISIGALCMEFIQVLDASSAVIAGVTASSISALRGELHGHVGAG